MRCIGLLGGVASGKSLVAGELVRLGAGLLEVQCVVHEKGLEGGVTAVGLTGKPCPEAMCLTWGAILQAKQG